MSDTTTQVQPVNAPADTEAFVKIMRDYGENEQQRYDALNERLDSIALQVQSDTDSETYQLTEEQWTSLFGNVQRIGDIGSCNLFLSLLLVCVTAALLGTRLFSLFSDGWRR